MKKKIAKLLALGMSIALVFSLAACGDDTTTEESTTDEAAVGLVDGEDPSAEPEPATGDETATGESESQSEAPADPNAPQQTGITSPGSDVAKAVSLYNDAVSKAGFSKANVQLSWGGSETSVGELNKLSGGKVKPEFEKPYSRSTKPGSISAGDVKSVSSQDNGSNIVMTIELKDYNGITASGSAYGNHSYPYFITYTDAAELVKRCGAAAGLNNIELEEKSATLNITGGVITATVDKESGKMTGLSFRFDQRVIGKAKVIFKVDAQIWGVGNVTFA